MARRPSDLSRNGVSVLRIEKGDGPRCHDRAACQLAGVEVFPRDSACVAGIGDTEGLAARGCDCHLRCSSLPAASLMPDIALPITPFEYSGAVLALLLVLRVRRTCRCMSASGLPLFSTDSSMAVSTLLHSSARRLNARS